MGSRETGTAVPARTTRLGSPNRIGPRRRMRRHRSSRPAPGDAPRGGGQCPRFEEFGLPGVVVNDARERRHVPQDDAGRVRGNRPSDVGSIPMTPMVEPTQSHQHLPQDERTSLRMAGYERASQRQEVCYQNGRPGRPGSAGARPSRQMRTVSLPAQRGTCGLGKRRLAREIGSRTKTRVQWSSAAERTRPRSRAAGSRARQGSRPFR